MDLLAPIKSSFTVTGAFPPSAGAHKTGCHDKGTCVDIVPTASGNPALIALMSNLENISGIGYMQLESNDAFCAGLCQEQQPGHTACTPHTSNGTQTTYGIILPGQGSMPCVVNPGASGQHIHVQHYAAGS